MILEKSSRLSSTIILYAWAGLYAKALNHSIDSGIGNLYLLSEARTRSTSPENFIAEQGNGGYAALMEHTYLHTSKSAALAAASDLGRKVSHYNKVEHGDTFTFTGIECLGAIKYNWITRAGKKCTMAITNIDASTMSLFYRIGYLLSNMPEGVAYFYTQTRRVDSLPCQDMYTIIDCMNSRSPFGGGFLCWEYNKNGRRGESEIKFHPDDDKEHPTICGTGFEGYFLGSSNFHIEAPRAIQVNEVRSREFTPPPSGRLQIIKSNRIYRSQTRYGFYRMHILDTVRFDRYLKISIHVLLGRGSRYLPLRDDNSIVAFWYRAECYAKYPLILSRDDLELNQVIY